MKEDIYKEIREKCNVWNEEQEKYYFSVVDIVQVLTDSADAKQYIKRMRSRDPELDSVWLPYHDQVFVESGRRYLRRSSPKRLMNQPV